MGEAVVGKAALCDAACTASMGLISGGVLSSYRAILVERDLILYESNIINEYIDERFPHPPLMPVDPVTRAHFRLALFRIEKDWYPLAEQIYDGSDRKPMMRAIKSLEESILSSVEIFAAKRFFLSDEFSLVDCTIAPILWRLPLFNIQLTPHAKPIQRYMDEVFSRPSFQASLTEFEQEMRTAGVDWTLVSFGGAVHCFSEPSAASRSRAPPSRAICENRCALALGVRSWVSKSTCTMPNRFA